MNTTVSSAGTSTKTGPVVDACVFHDWDSVRRYTPYMSDSWRNLVTRPGDPGGPVNFASRPHHYSPVRREEKNAVDVETLSAAFLDSGLRSRVVLGFEETLMATGFHSPRMAATSASAANDWTADQWLARDDRLFGFLLVASGLPDQAASEIRRVGGNPKIVGVELGANALGHPYGHPIYRPIFEAAAELGLPVMLHTAVDEGFDQGVSPVSGGPASTYAEHRAFVSQPLLVHATSMIIQGLFVDIPQTKVLLAGGGAAWIPAFLWRMDWLYHSNAREAPYLTRLPSEYFLQNFFVTTYALEQASSPNAVARALQTVPGIGDLLIYASGYPNLDCQEPDSIVASIPGMWRERVFQQNASKFFRWPAETLAQDRRVQGEAVK